MTLNPHDLQQISGGTLEHYERRAAEFWAGTRDHDVGQNIDALLRHVEGSPPYCLLDFGCGPGRDLKTLAARGHQVTGLDGSASFARMARAYSGCEVLEQDFLALELPVACYDGVFANASLFHVPTQELPRVLTDLWSALKPGGVLFASNPHGGDEEGWNNGRYGAYLSLVTWRAYLTAAGFVEIEHYYRPPGLPRAQQPWLASVWRKPAG